MEGHFALFRNRPRVGDYAARRGEGVLDGLSCAGIGFPARFEAVEASSRDHASGPPARRGPGEDGAPRYRGHPRELELRPMPSPATKPHPTPMSRSRSNPLPRVRADRLARGRSPGCRRADVVPPAPGVVRVLAVEAPVRRPGPRPQGPERSPPPSVARWNALPSRSSRPVIERAPAVVGTFQARPVPWEANGSSFDAGSPRPSRAENSGLCANLIPKRDFCNALCQWTAPPARTVQERAAYRTPGLNPRPLHRRPALPHGRAQSACGHRHLLEYRASG